MYHMPITREPSGFEAPKLKFKRTAYPSVEGQLPAMYPVICSVGPRGSGKSWLVASLLKSYEKTPPKNADDGTPCAIRTILISPTVDANPQFRALKSLDEKDVHREYSDKLLDDIVEDMERERAATAEYRRRKKLLQKFEKMGAKGLDRLKPDELLDLDEMEYAVDEPPRFPNGVCNFLVIDDMVGSAIYKSGRNRFLNFLLRNRHHQCGIILLVQSLKSLPRTLRANASCWIIHRFGTTSHLPDLYEEAGSALMKEDDFQELYFEATKDDHGALVIDFSKPKDRRFSISFHTIIRPN